MRTIKKTEADTIREAASLLVKGIDKKKQSNILLSFIYNPVERAALKAVKKYTRNSMLDTRDFAERVITFFYAEKFANPAFLAGLTRAEQPIAYCIRVVSNLTVDLLRREPSVISEQNFVAEEDFSIIDNTATDAQSIEEITIEIEQHHARSIHYRQLTSQLSTEDRLLLAVVHGDAPLDDDLAAQLKQRQTTESGDLLQAFNQRVEALEDDAHKRDKDIENRNTRLHWAQLRLKKIERMLSEQQAGQKAKACELDQNRFEELRASKQKLAEASAEEQAAMRDYYLQRETEIRRVQDESISQRHKISQRAHNWEEIVGILGLLTDEHTEQDKKRVINNLTVKYRRLIAKIKKQVMGEVLS